MTMLRRLYKAIGEFFSGIHIAAMYKATAQIEYEIREMENSFTLMLFGNFIGLPSPPMPLALDLLPVMADDLDRMLLRSSQTGNGLSELASIMGEP
ncbi:hypothetical protein SpiGrapes_0521 [Sphaerochaeta pleomorpha str. Grapes]|uniref:Uncharacterized protein n=1 Tax=Sphaerochaeta pleomorpha (strain ATCC BAA-1885 / DSM 22778 / Grapes) TaxID=158190 RepID=G8QWT1_SPHPG|nr:hypothetical protein [Sphaerochaeta pleomorpha]AEV28375.1 hypothetical protein SpiGrapes_0521 [Sphaerochaeta pleomorpha str. Grapes]